MLRLSGFLSIILAVCAGALLFWASHSVQHAEKRLAQAERSLAQENESLRVLVAEWDYLNRPERLDKLISSNVDIYQEHVLDKKILTSAEEIPEPVVPVLPRHKPQNLLHLISANKKHKRQLKKLKENEGEDFKSVLQNAAEMNKR